MKELDPNLQLQSATTLYDRPIRPIAVIATLSEFIRLRAMRRIGEGTAGRPITLTAQDWQAHVREKDESLTELKISNDGSDLTKSAFLQDEVSALFEDLF